PGNESQDGIGARTGNAAKLAALDFAGSLVRSIDAEVALTNGAAKNLQELSFHSERQAVLAAPELEKRGGGNSMGVAEAGLLRGDQRAYDIGIEQRGVGAGQHVAHVAAPVAGEPPMEWNGKTLLAGDVQLRREQFPREFSQKHLALSPPCAERARDAAVGEL